MMGIANFRQALKQKKKSFNLPYSKMWVICLKKLEENGYIDEYEIIKNRIIKVTIKYYKDRPCILYMKGYMKKGVDRTLTVLTNKKSPYNGLGITLLSTSKGILTDKEARKEGIGGILMMSVL